MTSKRHLLSLHSCTSLLGIAYLDINHPNSSLKLVTVETGKELSNNLFKHVNEILPFDEWKYIKRLSVATGPGSFTGTRITVSFCRTISQQIGCQLDGISSFKIMANRIFKENKKENFQDPLWITTNSSRRGIIGGLYKINNGEDISIHNRISELKKPGLLEETPLKSHMVEANDNVKSDVLELLEISFESYKKNIYSSWENVFPIYPTSPVS